MDGATGAGTLIQRFGSALNLNIHSHILFLDGVYVYRDNRPPRFQRVPRLLLLTSQGCYPNDKPVRAIPASPFHPPQQKGANHPQQHKVVILLNLPSDRI